MKPKPQTQAQRQKAHRDRGQSVTVVITAQDAIRALASIRAEHGGVKAGIEAALTFWLSHHGH